MSDEILEDKVFATFERYQEFVDAQQALLSADLFSFASPEQERKELAEYQKLTSILGEYQEQSYLLDPFLEELLEPVVERLKYHAKTTILNPNQESSPSRVGLIAHLLYQYVKCRGYKTIIRFFPHEIADLSTALEYMCMPNGIVQLSSQWPLRYIVLLWLSLICMIPFDLAQFDEPDRVGSTAASVEALAKCYLNKSGLEREGAALLLSRLYTRKDTGLGFHGFVTWSQESLKTDSDVFMTIGLLQVLCEVVKTGPPEQIKHELNALLSLASIIDQTKSLSSNMLVRKLKSKLVSRIALRILPQNPNAGRRKGRTLSGDEVDAQSVYVPELNIPEEVESILEQLFQSLQDKDTIVRWSTAKGIARIAERLPPDFSGQILETTMDLFAIHSVLAATLYDLPAIAESTWHGACLACAEMARRNLVSEAHMSRLVEWLSKALYFDIRKGSHSVGSSVRDAAAYVLWALARTQDILSLKPHANNLANRLVTVALYDREIHIRRAASAAFQENVGRTNLFPHGIDVLGKTDFYAVSVRKNAFLVAAPQVAEHLEYRSFLLHHVLDVVLRHWDITMRELGSQSLRLLCSIDLATLTPEALTKVARLLDSFDTTDIHGGLLALNEIAIVYRANVKDASILDGHLRDIFKHLARVPQDILTTPRNHLVAAAACQVIATTITIEEIQEGRKSPVPRWREIIDFGLKHRNKIVQRAAADAISAISELDLKAGPPSLQQSLAQVLGLVNYSKNRQMLPKSISFLLEGVKPSPRSTIETRRACYASIPLLFGVNVSQFTELFESDVINSLLRALLNGLNDYTIDERGDVGSWVRIVCLQGLTSICVRLLTQARPFPDLETYLPQRLYHSIISGILKQGVERLDNVRQEAGNCFMRLYNLPKPEIGDGERWVLPGSPLLKLLFEDNLEHQGWADGSWFFPRAVQLLGIPAYRKDVLTGVVLSIGSRTDSTQRPMGRSLVEYAEGLPIDHNPPEYSLPSLVDDLLQHASSNTTSNAVVVPIFQTFNVLLEAEVLNRLGEDDKNLNKLKTLFNIATKNVPRWKNVQRIHEAMKIAVSLLVFPEIRTASASIISEFLAHSFPRIRYETAEHLYLLLETADLDIDTTDVETILLETGWSSIETSQAKEMSEQVVRLLLGG